MKLIGDKKSLTKYWSERGLDVKAMTEVRWRCYHELAYLATCLGFTRFEVAVHAEVFDFFLHKDPTIPFEQFAKADSTTHDRLMLLPRGGFKSTADMIDMVQFIICWPDIAIQIITAKDDLGKDFLTDVRRHFIRNEDGSPVEINGELSIFQLAFPEFCMNEEGPKETFVSPARPRTRIEPTLAFGGVETDLTGRRCDVVCSDDSISNENSKNPTRLKTIKNQRALHRKNLNPYGYWTDIGTWYSSSDSYSVVIAAEIKNKTMFWNAGRGDSHDSSGVPPLTRIMIRPAMWPTKVVAEVDFSGDLREEDWTLWFPNRLTWKYLMKERALNFEMFATQLMQCPMAVGSIKFSRDKMVAATQIFTSLPDLRSGTGIVVQFWDTSYKAGNSWNNYSVGTTVLVLGGKFYILDIVRGQFNEHDLPKIMADFAFKWRPQRIAVEDANGIRYLARLCYDEFRRLGMHNIFIEFGEIENVKGRKKINALPFSKALSEGRIVISNAIPQLDYVYEEFEGFPSAELDDVVDSVCGLVAYYKDMPEAMVVFNTDESLRYKEMQRNRQLYDHIFGTGRMSPVMTNDAPREIVPSYVLYNPEKEWE